MIIILLMFHLLLCLGVYGGMRSGILKSTRQIFWLMALIPLWGPVCVLVLELRTRRKTENRRQVGIEKLKINDEVHKSIVMDEDVDRERVVPLEEALLLNGSDVRRELMMDILYTNPGDYIEQLKNARMNDDTEVVHYAVTALAELQKEYDLRFQKLDRRYAEHPEDGELLDEYMTLLENYIKSGILEGNMLYVQRKRYGDILEEKIKKVPELRSLYEKKANNSMALEEYDDVYQAARELQLRWPQEETGYLLLIKYYALVKDRRAIEEVLEKLEQKQVFLSAKGRKEVRFWKGENEENSR